MMRGVAVTTTKRASGERAGRRLPCVSFAFVASPAPLKLCGREVGRKELPQQRGRGKVWLL